MNRLFRPRMTLALALTTLAPAAAASEPDGYTLLQLGDTAVVQLDEQRFEATSDTGEPVVRFEGKRVTIAFCKTSSGLAPGGSLGFGVGLLDDGVRVGDFTVDFDAEPAPTSPYRSPAPARSAAGLRQGELPLVHFDGRLLTADDLNRDQAYRPSCEGSATCRFTLSGGGRVVVFDGHTDRAPFVLDALPEGFEAEPVTTADGHRGEIEITSWSFGGTTATLDTGERLVVETVTVSSHELGHALGIHHTTVSAHGTDTLSLEVDSDGVLDSIATLVRSPSFDVHGNLWVELDPTSTATSATARFQAEAGVAQRVRVRVSGGSWGGFSAWSQDRVDLRLPVPAPGQEHHFDYEVERRTSAGAPTIGGHGYIKIKKLNSGG
jgi:hypothetical protein